MTYDIDAPYGPLVETRLRVVAWNVWGRYGPWEAREQAIKATLARDEPDVVVLVEAWQTAEDSQATRLGSELGLGHHTFAGDVKVNDALSGSAVLSPWPISRHEQRRLGSQDGYDAGHVLFTEIDGPRGIVQVFAVSLGWRLDHSAARQEQVRDLTAFILEVQQSGLLVVCGDFNAGPDTDEIRMLTGKTRVAAPGLVFYDAWELAGSGGPGHTWSNANPWAAPVLFPDRRIDHVFSVWPRRGGVGHPLRCEVIGTEPVDGVVASDHYGVLADLRY